MSPEGDSTELQSLLDRLRGGDREAWGLLCGWVEQRIRSRARFQRALNPRIALYAVTDDIVQDVLRRLVLRFQAVAAEIPTAADDFLRWLALWSARNLGYVLADLAREHYGPGDRKHVPSGLNHDDPALKAETGEERARRRQIRTYELIQELPERERAVIELRYYQDESKAEVARLLNIDRETVTSLQLSAEARLGRWIRREDGDDFRDYTG